jgi:hypothetical protein
VRIYAHPGRTEFVQLPDRVLILHEVMQQFRIVRLNSTHSPLEELDPSWWGDSIGWYENGDTLVVDTVGTNGRTWLTQTGHPSTEKLHVIERYRRVKREVVEFEATVDDPGAYTKPFTVRRMMRLSPVPFMRVPWNCSVRDNMEFIDKLLNACNSAATMGTKLPLIERSHLATHRDNSVVCLNFEPADTGDMTAHQVIDDPTFQIPVGHLLVNFGLMNHLQGTRL